jgi:hypothetical protein
MRCERLGHGDRLPASATRSQCLLQHNGVAPVGQRECQKNKRPPGTNRRRRRCRDMGQGELNPGSGATGTMARSWSSVGYR